jgi:parvulin-like peptidyl-prolyl isomerase
MILGIAILAAVLAVGCSGGTTSGKPETPPNPAPAESVPTTPIAEAPADGETAAPVPEPPAIAEPPAEPVPDVVAKVGDKTIAGKDFERQLKHATRMSRQRGIGGDVSAAQKRDIIGQMVNDEIVNQAAEKAGVAFTREEAVAEIEKAKQSMPSPDMFKRYLEAMEIDEDTLIELVRQQKLRERFVEEGTKGSPVTEEELLAEYNKMKELGNLERKEESADVQHILIKVEGADEAVWEEGKKKIEAIRQRILGGEDFGTVAQEVTEDPGSKQRGGAYPDTPRGKMVPEFDERMWTLPIGEVSEPFRTQFGWHILKVNARYEKGTMKLEEIRTQMTQMLERQKEQAFVEKTIDEAKPAANVEILYTPDEAAPPVPPMMPEGGAPEVPAAPETPAAPEAPAAAAP